MRRDSGREQKLALPWHPTSNCWNPFSVGQLRGNKDPNLVPGSNRLSVSSLTRGPRVPREQQVEQPGAWGDLAYEGVEGKRGFPDVDLVDASEE